MCNCTCSSNEISKKHECPVCHTPGQSVLIETVQSLVKTTTMPIIKDAEFSICLAPDCEVVYFSNDAVFLEKDVTIPVAFKTGTTPKFICYCNHVTEEEIARAVIDGGAKTISDITRITGAMKNGRCLTTNPKGVCCHKDIEAVIQRTVEKGKASSLKCP